MLISPHIAILMCLFEMNRKAIFLDLRWYTVILKRTILQTVFEMISGVRFVAQIKKLTG